MCLGIHQWAGQCIKGRQQSPIDIASSLIKGISRMEPLVKRSTFVGLFIWYVHLSVCLSISIFPSFLFFFSVSLCTLSLCLFLSLCFPLNSVTLFLRISVYSSLRLSITTYFNIWIYMSLFLSVSLSVCLIRCLSLFLSVSMSFCLSVCTFICLSVRLSVHMLV